MSKMRDMILRPLVEGGADAVHVPPHLQAECDLPLEPGLHVFGDRTYRMTVVDGWAKWERIETGTAN